MLTRPRLVLWAVTLLVLAGVVTAVVVREETYVAGQAPETPSTPDAGGAALALRGLHEAVDARDLEAADELATAASVDLVRSVLSNAGQLDVVDFSLRYVDETSALTPDGRWSAAVDMTWRFEGFDDEQVHVEAIVDFESSDGAVRIVGLGGGDRRTPLWLSGPVEVSRGENSLVLAAGESGSADSLAALADVAVRQVQQVLPDWPGRLVVEVPSDASGLDSMLAADPGTYANIAAVSATVDGVVTPTSPTHVFVNPDLFGQLGDEGEQVVMTHEATHIATSAPLVSGVPPWLVEGFADYVALRSTALPLSTTAGQILEQVREVGAPETLPGANDFDPTAPHLGSVYEAAWLACVVAAEVGGEPGLVALYKDVQRGADLDAALAEHVGITEARLTTRWQRRLRDLATTVEVDG